MPTALFDSSDLSGFTDGFNSGPNDAGVFVTDAPSSSALGTLTMHGVGTTTVDPRFLGTDFVFEQSATLDHSAIPGTAIVSHVRIRVPWSLRVRLQSQAVSDPNSASYDFTIRVNSSPKQESGSGLGNPANFDQTFTYAGEDADYDFDFSSSPIDMATFASMFGTQVVQAECTDIEANGNTGTCYAEFDLALGGWEMEVTYENEGGTGAIYAASRLGIQKSNNGTDWVLLTALFGKKPSNFYPRSMLVYPPSNVLFYTDPNVDPFKVYNYDGESVVENNPPSAGTFGEIIGFTYDSTNERMYVLYYDDVDFDVTLMAYWDGVSWTSVDTSALLADGGLAFYSRMECLGDSVFLCVVSSNLSDPTEVIVYRSDGGDPFVVDSVIPDLIFNADSAPSVMQACGDEIFLLWDNYDFGSGNPQQFVYKRDSLGDWTNVSPTTFGDYARISDVQFFGNEVYVTFDTVAIGGTEVKILKRDVDGIWSLEFDVEADDTNSDIQRIRDLVEFNGELLAGAEDSGSEGLTWSYRQTAPGTWERFTINGGAYLFSLGGGSGSLIITNITPAQGPIGGNIAVDIEGIGFDPDVEILFDQFPTIQTIWNSSTSLTVVIPPHAIGLVDVTATNPDDGEFYTATDGFEYVDDLPQMEIDCGLTSPANGTMLGGTTVTIFGEFPLVGVEVFFGGFPATDVVVDPTGDFLTCVTPAHPVGPVDITVTVTI